ncbi:hypothetical protein FQA39_LY00861 [Lamprigera yunnana]|nr:hypothetical protein FQA39_LY00861 [Lamprigera yunnana]
MADLTIAQAGDNGEAIATFREANEKIAIDVFTRGIRNREVRTVTRARNFKSLSEVINAAKKKTEIPIGIRIGIIMIKMEMQMGIIIERIIRRINECHLATLLKTAEELRIKGLAEVSWRDDETNTDTNVNGVQSALPHVSTIMDSPKNEPPNKRKRGRPPIDDYEQTFTTPKITSVTGNAEEGYSNDAMSSSDQDLSIWEEESGINENDHNDIEEIPKFTPQPSQQQSQQTPTPTNSTTQQQSPSHNQHSSLRIKSESLQEDDSSMDESPVDYGSDSKYDIPSSSHAKGNNAARQSLNSSSAASTSSLTVAIEKEWPDVIKMNDYLSTGRRQQFWEEPFTKRVMDAIKTKNLEMKIAAELLGVSYGTLYGRYRDAYGCLKHPYRVRDFWCEQGPTDILLKLRRKEVTLFRAAEQLNVTPQTLSNYLISMSQLDTETMTSDTGAEKYEEGESDEESDSVIPDHPVNTSIFKSNKSSNSSPVLSTNATTSVLPNCPDVTVIKKEKLEGLLGKMNNNSDHSNSQSNNSDPSQK